MFSIYLNCKSVTCSVRLFDFFDVHVRVETCLDESGVFGLLLHEKPALLSKFVCSSRRDQTFWIGFRKSLEQILLVVAILSVIYLCLWFA
jgi:hypothetical protein